jgi:hypothetical protein
LKEILGTVWVQTQKKGNLRYELLIPSSALHLRLAFEEDRGSKASPLAFPHQV